MATRTDLIKLDFPLSQITNPVFPPGEKISTNYLRPRHVMGIIGIFTACVLYRHKAPLWTWPVAILTTTLLSYAVMKLFGWDKDRLVEAMYTIAGNKKAYEALPLLGNEPIDKTAPLFRFVTPDGRRGLVINGTENENVQIVIPLVERFKLRDINWKDLNILLIQPFFGVHPHNHFIETDMANRVIAQIRNRS